MARQLPPRPLGVTDTGRRLHAMYPAMGHFGFVDAPDVGGCGVTGLHRATEDQKNMMTYCTARGCVGVPHE